MQQRLYCFLVVFLLIFHGKIFSQGKDSLMPRSFFVHPVFSKTDLIRLNIIQSDFYSKHLTFFCRKELQIEKSTSIPFRLRLGSLEYTNYLEQKPNALKPGRN
ncbi:MAG: hypothetical protein JWM28_528 [Chitinophagaceae bacterium]|nr:hypothetical protein [Chitinophagaceae bacterium]